MFENIDLLKLFDNEGEYGKEYSFGELTDEMISRAEKNNRLQIATILY